jgi:hypothetical protein
MGWFGLLLGAVLLIGGCGGGGGGSNSDGGTTTTPSTPPTPPLTTLSGTAAAGAPIQGTVSLRDSAGTTRTQTINSIGEFQFDLTGLTPPYLLWADGVAGGKEAFFYSMATEGGRANVTPATHCILAMALGKDPVSYYRENPDAATPDAAKVDAAKLKLASLFDNLYETMGVPAGFDLMTGQFAADGKGFDGIMDIVEMVSDDEFVSIIDRGSSTAMYKQELATGNVVAEETPEKIDELCTASHSVLNEIKTIMKKFSDQFATAKPTYEQLLPVLQPLMSDEFRHDGQDREERIANQVNAPIGHKFENIALYRKMKKHNYGAAAPWSIDELPAGYAEGVWCTYSFITNRTQPRINAFVRETPGGPWKMHGNQNPFQSGGIVEAESVWSKNKDRLRLFSGLRLRAQDSNNSALGRFGIVSFMVLNKALPPWTSPSGNSYNALILTKDADPSVNYNITSTWWSWQGRHFEKDGLDINAITDKEFIFVGLDAGNNPVHVWIDLLDKKPVQEVVLWKDQLDKSAGGEFSSYFSELLSILGQPPDVYMPLSSLNPASVPLQWELSPMGEYMDYVEVGLRDGTNSSYKGNSNPAFTEPALSLADWLSATLDISSLGVTWPPVSGWSFLLTRDQFQRRLETYTDFQVANPPDPSIILTGQYLQYRTYSDPARNQFRGWVDFLDRGLPIEDVITSVRLTNLTTSTQVPVESAVFQDNIYYFNNSWDSAANKLGPVWEPTYYSGYGVYFPIGTDLSAGNYQLEATTQAGDDLTGQVITLGNRLELPVVNAASMASEWVNGDLKLSWQDQPGPQNRARIWIVGGDPTNFDVILGLYVPAGTQEVVIPKRAINNAKALRDYDSAHWTIELHYSENNNNSARSYSDYVMIDGWK